MFVQLPNHRRTRNEGKGRVVDMRCGQADDLEELGHEAEAILCGVKKIPDVDDLPSLR